MRPHDSDKPQKSHDPAVFDTPPFCLCPRFMMPARNRERCQKKALSTVIITAVIFLIAVLIIVVLHSSWQPLLEKVAPPHTLNHIRIISSEDNPAAGA